VYHNELSIATCNRPPCIRVRVVDEMFLVAPYIAVEWFRTWREES
jgi:hypothetical protein